MHARSRCRCVSAASGDAAEMSGRSLSCWRIRYDIALPRLTLGKALTLSDIEKCASVSVCVSDDRSVLGGGGRPVMQTRCARDEGYGTNRRENETSACLRATALSADCESGANSLRTDHICQSVNIILALISSCFIWLHKSCGLHAASAVTGLSSWRNDMIMAVWKEMSAHYFIMWRVCLTRRACTFQSRGKGTNNRFVCKQESRS